VVVDHDSGRLVWAAPGRDTATLGQFFDALGAERVAQITRVSADAADWIDSVRLFAVVDCRGVVHRASP
jgi:transposase